MGGGTITFRIKMPSIRLPSLKVVRLPAFSVQVNPLLLVLLAAVIVYASFEHARVEIAGVRSELGRSIDKLTEQIWAINSTKNDTSPLPAPIITLPDGGPSPPPRPAAPAPKTDNGNAALVDSLSQSVSKMNDELSKINSLGRYYSSKIELTAFVKTSAATAAQKSYSESADQCMKLSDSQERPNEKNRTLCRNAKSIYYWVRDGVKYEPEYETGYKKGYVQLPYETLSALVGGSADQSVLLVSLLRSRGIEAYLVGMPANDYMVVAAGLRSLPDSYPDSASWKTRTSTGIKQPPYDYYGDQKELVLLDPACKLCLFGKLQEKHRDLVMEMLTYYNATGSNN